MSFFFFAHSMFGQLFAIRILRQFRDRALISRPFLRKVGITFAGILAFGPSILFSSPKYSFLFVISALLALRLVLSVREAHEKEQLIANLPYFFDRWLLNLRTGSSFSRARDQALFASNTRFQALMAPLLDPSTKLNRQKHAFVDSSIVDELRKIHATSPLSAARLENLRRKLLGASEFRRKSGHALRQAQVQGVVLLVLHFALVGFTIHQYGWRNHGDLIVLATVLTCFGQLLLRFMARRIRWTI